MKVKIYRTTILPVVLHGCKIGSLTLMEVHRLRVFKNGVLKKMRGPKMNEVKEYWRKLHNVALQDLYSAPKTIWVIKLRIMRKTRHVACVEERRVA
jgi:hypothetical protein